MKNNKSSKTKIILKTLFAITIIATIAIATAYHLKVQPIFNYNLYVFTNNLENIPLPPKTQRIGATHSSFGLLSGNSNHCDYSASYLIKTELTPIEIKEHYRNKTIPPAEPENPTFNGAPQVQQSTLLNKGNNLHQKYQVTPESLTQNVYLIYALDVGYPPRYPICH